MQARTYVRDADAEVPAELALVGDVELFDAGALQVKRNGVRRQSPEVVRVAHTNGTAGEGRDAARVNASGQTRSVPLADRLVEAVCRQSVAHALRRRSRIEHA